MKATLLAKIGLDSSGFSAGIKDVSKQTSGLEKQFGSLKKWIAGAFSVTAVTSFLRSVQQTADEIYKATQEADATSAGYQSLRNAMRDAGQSADGLNGYLSKLRTAAIDAQDGNAKLMVAFDSLGISVSDLRSMKTDELFGAIAEAVAGSEDATTSYGAVLDIFGNRMASKVLPALQSVGEEGFGNLKSRMEEAGRVMSDEFLVAVNNLETRWDTMKQKAAVWTSKLVDGIDALGQSIGWIVAYGGDYAAAMEAMEEATVEEAKAAARLAVEEEKKRENMEAARKAAEEAAQQAAKLAAEEEALQKAEEALWETEDKLAAKRDAALPVTQKLEKAEAELAEAAKRLQDAEDNMAYSKNAETVALYTKALKAHAEKQEEVEKLSRQIADAENKVAKATQDAKQKYEDYLEEQELSAKSAQEQAQYHKDLAERMKKVALAMDESAEKYDLLHKAAKESAEAEKLYKQAQDEAAEATANANEKLAESVEEIQKLSEYVAGLSQEDFDKIVDGLGELGKIAEKYDFSNFAGLSGLSGLKLPSFTSSQVRQFARGFEVLADALKDVKITVPEGLEKLGQIQIPSGVTTSKVNFFTAALRALAAGLKDVSIDVPEGLEKLGQIQIPSLTSSRARQFGRALQELANSIKAADIDAGILGSLAELASALSGTPGGATITLVAPSKEDLTLAVPKGFESDVSSLAKSAATLAKLKGVIYA